MQRECHLLFINCRILIIYELTRFVIYVRSWQLIAREIESATSETIRLAVTSRDGILGNYGAGVFESPFVFPFESTRSSSWCGARAASWKRKSKRKCFRWANRCIRSGDQVVREIGQVAFPTGLSLRRLKWTMVAAIASNIVLRANSLQNRTKETMHGVWLARCGLSLFFSLFC